MVNFVKCCLVSYAFNLQATKGVVPTMPLQVISKIPYRYQGGGYHYPSLLTLAYLFAKCS